MELCGPYKWPKITWVATGFFYHKPPTQITNYCSLEVKDHLKTILPNFWYDLYIKPNKKD